jgi:DNA polymerase I-like protein with 3'-5' exonuclease and polymerase domains
MMRAGIFQYDEKDLSVVEIIEDGFYRLDIIKPGYKFQVEPAAVVYSIYKIGRTTRVFGQRRFKERYDEVINKVKFANLPISTETGMEDGKFVRKQIKGQDKSAMSVVIERAGEVEKESYYFEEDYVELTTVAKHGNKIEPMNKIDYEIVEVAKGKSVKVKSPYVPLATLKSMYDLSHLENANTKVITDNDEALAYISEIDFRKIVVGVDVETTGVDVDLYGEDKLVGFVISKEEGDEARYFPFAHTEFENLSDEVLLKIFEKLSTAKDEVEAKDLENISKMKLLARGVSTDGFYGTVGHNTKFEDKVFMKTGLELAKKFGFKVLRKIGDRAVVQKPYDTWGFTHDSLEASFIERPEVAKGIHTLKAITSGIKKKKFLEFSDIFIDPANINFANLDKELVRFYACADSYGSRDALRDRWYKMPKDSRAIYELECKLMHVKAIQEFWGWRIDAESFLDGYNKTQQTVDTLSDLIRVMAKWPDLNISSDDQLSELLYNRMRAPVYLRTATGRPSTGVKALNKLATIKREEPVSVITEDIRDGFGVPIIRANDLNSAKYPLVLLLQSFRDYDKLMTSFYRKIENSAVGYFSKKESGILWAGQDKPALRFFFSINQNGTKTGRQSSQAHTLPKAIKALCLSDSEDHMLAITDYAQIELRIFFSMAGEKDFIAQCEDPGNDIHRVIGAPIAKKEMWEISAPERKKGKSRNFGVVYLMSAFGLAGQLYGAAPSAEQVKECQGLIDDLFQTYKRLTKKIKENKRDLYKYGKVRTELGRYAYFNDIFDPDISSKAKASIVRQANNTPVQGTAADVMKIAEVQLEEYITRKGWDNLVETPQGMFPLVRTIISAHDEVALSFHKSIPVEEILEMKRECMEMKFEGWAPLYGSTSIVDTWVEGKADEYAIPIDLREKLIKEYHETGKSCIEGTDNIKKQLLAIINEHRDKELNGYMESLVAKHGKDPKTIADNVRHPTLTHELISRYKQTKEHKMQHGELTHIESILYAVEKYLEGANISEEARIKDSEEVSDFDVKSSIEEITGLSGSVSYLDQNGELVYTEEYHYDEDEGYSILDGDAESLEKTVLQEKIVVFSMLDLFIIDFEGLTIKQADEGLKLIHSMSKPDGFSRIQIKFQGKLIDTGMRADTLDEELLENFVYGLTTKHSLVGG